LAREHVPPPKLHATVFLFFIHKQFCRYDQGVFFERSEAEALRLWQRAAEMGYEQVVDKLSWRMRRALVEASVGQKWVDLS
jgi:hypothetical protein